MKYLDLKEFRDKGYLAEVNRRFFHPLGLAMGVTVQDDGTATDLFIFDSRDDPEGWAFGVLTDEPEEVTTADLKAKAHFVDTEWARFAAVRMERFGFMVQPAGNLLPSSASPVADEEAAAPPENA